MDSDILALARRVDPDRFLCALFAPADLRPALCALIALNHELARAHEAAREPTLALIRLQWWRDAIEEAASGQPARRHEVAAPLHAAIRAGRLEPAALLALCDAREAEGGPLETEAAFEAYLRATGGGFAVAAARLLDAPPASLPLVQRIGALVALAGVLRNLEAHAAQGRVLLPQDRLAAAGGDARALPALLAAEAARDLSAVRPAAVLPRAAIAAVLPAVLAERDLRRLAAGRPVPPARGLGDRLAVVAAGLRGRI